MLNFLTLEEKTTKLGDQETMYKTSGFPRKLGELIGVA